MRAKSLTDFGHAGKRMPNDTKRVERRAFGYLSARRLWSHTGTDRRSGKMKIKNSLKALKTRHRENRLVRRKGRVYIINKQNPRFKARQG